MVQFFTHTAVLRPVSFENKKDKFVQAAPCSSTNVIDERVFLHKINRFMRRVTSATFLIPLFVLNNQIILKNT